MYTRRLALMRRCETAYVDDNLVGSKKLSKAAIVGAQGGVWAASSGFTVRRDQLLLWIILTNLSTS